MKRFKYYGSRVAAGSALLMGSVTAAYADLPAAATTAFTQLETDAMALVDLAWTAAIPITIAFIILRMFKRAASSAT